MNFLDNLESENNKICIPKTYLKGGIIAKEIITRLISKFSYKISSNIF